MIEQDVVVEVLNLEASWTAALASQKELLEAVAEGYPEDDPVTVQLTQTSEGCNTEEARIAYYAAVTDHVNKTVTQEELDTWYKFQQISKSLSNAIEEGTKQVIETIVVGIETSTMDKSKMN